MFLYKYLENYKKNENVVITFSFLFKVYFFKIIYNNHKHKCPYIHHHNHNCHTYIPVSYFICLKFLLFLEYVDCPIKS